MLKNFKSKIVFSDATSEISNPNKNIILLSYFIQFCIKQILINYLFDFINLKKEYNRL